MLNIRQAQPGDLKRVEYICRMTAGPLSQKDEYVGNVTAKVYSTYYIREEHETCFLLEDDGEAVGYVLCAPDFRRFAKIYRRVDAPAIMKLEKQSGFLAYAMPALYRLFGAKYPAHLHIDILEGYRGGGNGSRLIQTLLNKLKADGVKGVMLAVDTENTGAVRFYEKNGFHKVISVASCTVMAQKIN